MKNSRKVIAVAVAVCSELGTLTRTGVNKVHLDGDPFRKIEIKVPASLEISSKKEDKADIYSAKLVFITCQDRFDTVSHQAFKARLADGTSVLIGGPERPFTVVSTQRSLTTGNSDSQLLEVTVAYSSPDEIPFLS